MIRLPGFVFVKTGNAWGVRFPGGRMLVIHVTVDWSRGV